MFPVILLAASGISAIVGMVKTSAAGGRIKAAKKKYDSRRYSYDKAIGAYRNKHKHASRQFESLGEIRLRASVDLGRAVTFLEKAKLKERELFEKFQITPENMLEWKKVSIHAVEILGGLVSSAFSGVATSAAVYGLVGLLGTASTGTAISTLSGAALSNATLAWLGGGAISAGGGGIAMGTVVFGGLTIGPALLVVGFFASAKAGKVENQVEQAISEMDIDEAQKLKVVDYLKACLKRVYELRDSTVRMQDELRSLLEKSDPENEKDAYLVAKTAKALGQLLEIAILTKDGELV